MEGLTQFARKQDRKDFTDFNLSEILQEILRLIRESFDRKIAVVEDIPDHLPVCGDAADLSQAVMNLCTNARDAMPHGGTLTIRAKSGDGQTIVTVADTGVGMDAATQEKCMDPFFTTKEVGTGLGLSTSYGIVKAHHGTLQLASEPGKGSRFTISLPEGTKRVQPKEEDIGQIVRGSGEKVLVVDDDPDIHSGLAILLQKIGYVTLSASDGVEAVLRQRDFDPDIVLLDKNMPGMDSADCLEELLDKDPGANVVVISGYDPDGPNGLNGSEQSRIRGFLKKPVDIGELSMLLKEILNPTQPPPAAG
ncbi:MAG: response regulator [Desulfobacteraceae bacterium]|nr:response regulator [Desulfobacteraceae bacterium]